MIIKLTKLICTDSHEKIAYSSSTLYITKSLIISSIIGLIAASCKCKNNDNTPVNIDQVINKFENISKRYEL